MSPSSDAGALARDVRARRRHLHLTQRDVAELSGTSVRFVGSLEQGKSSVRLDKLLAVVEALGLELRADVRNR